MTICLRKPYIEDKLKNFGKGINGQSYDKFLKGDLWDKRMLEIDYDNVALDIKKYVTKTKLKDGDGKSKNFKPDISVSTTVKRTKCFTFHNPPRSNIYMTTFRLSTAIFPQFIRPSGFGWFALSFTFPNQLFRSSETRFGSWPNRKNAKNPFVMNFRIFNIQVLRRRDRRSNPSYNWRTYDDIISE